jgi:macrolide transport system ATP-binding/permease protein
MNWRFWRKTRRNQDLAEEISAHLALAETEAMESGENPRNARYAARKEFGNVAVAEELTRETWGRRWLSDFFQDIRIGLRILRRSPGFSLLAILCLTLGIGANAAVFSWIEGLLFRPYPLVSHQERLVAIGGYSRADERGGGLSWPDYLDLQRSCTLCETTFVSKITGSTLSIGDRAERTTGSIVSANYFDAIGVHPILGRGFLPGEDLGQRAHPVVVISYRLWQGRFNGDPAIVGKTQRFDGVLHTIVGVAPETFYGTFVGWAMNFWVPASMEELFEGGGYKLEDRAARWIEAYARLKPGVSLQQAHQEFAAISQRLEAEYPVTDRGRAIQLWPLWQTPFNNARTLLPTLEIMVVVVVFVLLIACANVGNLLLVRSFARRHEMSVRLAIGAGPARLWKQLFTEGLVLSAFGATGGLLVAYWCRHLLALLFPARGGVHMYLPGELDGRVLALSAVVCLLATILLGVVPAMQTGKIDLASSLKMEASGVVGGRGRAWIRSGLVLVQVSLSFILLVGAGLLMQSLLKIRNTTPGFTTRGVQLTRVDLVSAGYDTTRAQTFEDALLDRVRALPGVESAAAARMVPLSYVSSQEGPITVDGYTPPPDQSPTAQYNEVGPSFLATLGIPLVAGREFTRADDEKAAPVAIVNETMAARFWNGRTVLGERLHVKGRWFTVIGIAKDAKYDSVRENSIPFFYLALRQNGPPNSFLFVRTPLAPDVMGTAIAREVRALDANLASSELITMQEQLERSTSAQTVAVTLVGVLCVLALLLAAVGLYGVMSYAVSQSTRELGLRMALGAGPSNLLRLVLSRGLTLTAGGIVLGAAVAWGLTRLLGNLLYKVSPRDPLSFASAFALMAIVAVAACLLPAWRATRTDPVRALQT